MVLAFLLLWASGAGLCAQDVWDGRVADGFAGGSGTEADPYLISNGAELAKLANDVNNVTFYDATYFRLTADIVLNENSENYAEWDTTAPKNEWTPIGNSSRKFGGIFDGNGHTVKGVYINDGSEYLGLFGNVLYGTIKNLQVAESFIKGSSSVGGVVGYMANGTLEGCFNSALEAIPALREEPVDLLFLDIQMPELSGLEFSKLLGEETRVIFTTAFDRYAVDSYRVNALDYLLKPISYADFLAAANKALRWYELTRDREESTPPAEGTAPGIAPAEPESIFVKSEYKLLQIELRKILYIEGLKDYVKIYVEGEPRPVLSLMSMKSLEEMLPPDRFVRVHRSFIVQPEKIKVIERNRIVFGKAYIPISDSYKQRFMEILERRSILPR